MHGSLINTLLHIFPTPPHTEAEVSFWVTAERGDSRTVRDPEKCKGGLALGSDCANFNSFRGSRISYQSTMIYIFMLILLINIAWGIVSLHYFFRVNAKGMGQVANTETSLSHTEYRINNAAFVRE